MLLVTPLVELGAPQTDWIRAARARGIPTALGVASWDNLTVKGGLREWPDRVLVWNDAQVREACEIHGVPAERLVATGAHTYDHWFDWQPSRTREAFCAEVGLPADRPFLLYLCSSPFIAPGEAAFVREWIAGLRSSERPELRDAGVLVRPHPQHAAQWAGVDVADLGAAVVWPPAGADPVEAASRSDFFDSMAHCAGVVGVNTSAQIESAIVGRDVFTLLDPRFAATQEGTLHFAHLAREDGGLLQVGHSTEEHHAQLSAAACRRARLACAPRALPGGVRPPERARRAQRAGLRAGDRGPAGPAEPAAARLRLACCPRSPPSGGRCRGGCCARVFSPAYRRRIAARRSTRSGTTRCADRGRRGPSPTCCRRSLPTSRPADAR